MSELTSTVEPVEGDLSLALKSGISMALNKISRAGSGILSDYSASTLLEELTAAIARAAPATSPEPDVWRPIEKAPEDFGAVIDLWAQGERHTDCCWMWPTYGVEEYTWCRHAYDDSNGPVYNIVRDATHWMPVPSSPKAESRTKLETIE